MRESYEISRSESLMCRGDGNCFGLLDGWMSRRRQRLVEIVQKSFLPTRDFSGIESFKLLPTKSLPLDDQRGSFCHNSSPFCTRRSFQSKLSSTSPPRTSPTSPLCVFLSDSLTTNPHHSSKSNTRKVLEHSTSCSCSLITDCTSRELGIFLNTSRRFVTASRSENIFFFRQHFSYHLPRLLFVQREAAAQ